MPTYQPGPYEQQAGNAIQGAGAAGFFNPQGSPAIRANLRRNALRNADNMRRRSALLSRFLGLDPNQARVAEVNADTEANRGTADLLGRGSLDELLSNRDYFRGLFGNQLGGEQQRNMMRYQQDLSNPGLGGFLGGLLGQSAGAIIPGLFGAYRQPKG